jgi:plasmid stabilization system protein ParE
MAHRLSPEAETDLDEIWLYVAKEAGVEIADRLIDSIAERFWLISLYPHIGRRRDHDLLPGLQSFQSANTSSSTAGKAKTCSYSA